MSKDLLRVLGRELTKASKQLKEDGPQSLDINYLIEYYGSLSDKELIEENKKQWEYEYKRLRKDFKMILNEEINDPEVLNQLLDIINNRLGPPDKYSKKSILDK